MFLSGYRNLESSAKNEMSPDPISAPPSLAALLYHLALFCYMLTLGSDQAASSSTHKQLVVPGEIASTLLHLSKKYSTQRTLSPEVLTPGATSGGSSSERTSTSCGFKNLLGRFEGL